MKIISLGRGQGKTTRLLYASEFNNIPILCSTYIQKGYLMDRAKQLGLDIPKPVTIDEIISNKVIGKEEVDKDILVDDAHWVLQSFLHSFGMRGNIRAITLTKED